MAYLSRVWINPLRNRSRELLSSPQKMHAAVLGGLAIQPVSERVLWRVDADEPRRPSLFVLTRSSPSWEHLVEQAGWPSSDEPQAVTKSYDPLLRRIAAGSEFAFRLTANPVQFTRSPDKASRQVSASAEPSASTRSLRLGHRTAEHQQSWFAGRANKWGFEVPEVRSLGDGADLDMRILARGRRTFSRGTAGQKLSLQVVTYEGHLVVVDPDVFRAQLLAGFGPAKAYGCGLMTLAAFND